MANRVNHPSGIIESLSVSLPLPDRDLSPNARVYYLVAAAAKKQARYEAYLSAGEARIRANWPMCGPCRATVQVTWPDKRRRDLDNLLASCKAYWDGFTDAGVWRDDAYVTWVLPPARVNKAEAGVIVTIEAMD